MPTQTIKISAEQNDLRLDVVLTQLLTEVPSRTYIRKLIDAGQVSVNKKIVKAHYKVSEGDAIHVDMADDFLPPENSWAVNGPG